MTGFNPYHCGDCGYLVKTCGGPCACRRSESVEYNRGPEHGTLLDRWLADPLNNVRPDAITDRRSVKK